MYLIRIIVFTATLVGMESVVVANDSHWKFRPFITPDGAPFQEVRDLLEHRDGSIWIATWGSGVTRLKGTEWTTFDESNGLASNWTRCLETDKTGAVWVGTADGVARIRGTEIDVFNASSEGTFPNDSIASIERLQDGRIWVGFGHSPTVVECRPAAQPVWREVTEADLPTAVRCIFSDSSGVVWIACDESNLVRYDGQDWSLSNVSLIEISETSDGSVCGINHSTVFHLVDDQWESEPIINRETAQCVAPGSAGRLLIGTQRGIYDWRPNSWKEVPLPKPRYARAVVRSRDGENIYFGTITGLLRGSRPTWLRFSRTAEGHDLLPSSLCFDPQGQAICAHSERGLASFQNGVWQEFVQVADDVFRPDEAIIVGDVMWALCGHTLLKIALPSGKVLRKLAAPSEERRSQAEPSALFATSSGQLWLIYKQAGIFAVEKDGLRQLDANRDMRFPSPRCIAEHPDGSFFVCYRNFARGVATVKRWNGNQVEALEDHFPLLKNWDFEAVACASDGRVWLGTHDAGIFVYDGNSVQRITTADGLRSNLISRIWEAPDGTIWVAYRERGIGSYREGLWINHGADDGLPVWISDGMGQDADGRVWVGKPKASWTTEEIDGLFLYNPDSNPPRTLVEAYPTEGISSHGIGVFSFSGRDAWGTTPSDRLAFSWRFVPAGMNADLVSWSPYSTKTSVLTDASPLSPGDYRFQVRSVDLSRNVDPTPATVTFNVALPFWRRIEFVLPMIVLSAIALIAVFSSVRHHRAALTETRARLEVHVQREKAESELKKTQAMLAAAVEASPAGIIIADAPNVRIRAINSAALAIRDESFGALSDIPFELHAERWRCFHPDGRPYEPEELPLSRAVLEGFVSHNVDVIMERNDGERRWVLGNAAPVRSDSGEIVAGVVVFPDVTELKAAESKLRKLNDELEQRVEDRTEELRVLVADLEAFSYTVSHDLRAPLRAMEGFAVALVEDYGHQLGEGGIEYVSHIAQSADRMNLLIKDLLTYSRLGRSELPLTAVGWKHVITESLNRLAADIANCQADIHVDDTLPTVIGHESTLVHVASNLMSNAMKFVSKGVTPKICVRGDVTNDGFTRLFVEDNGIGIEQERQEQVFGVFKRLHGIESYPGTGIGLAIVARVCERLGGRYGLESELGSGSRFWVDLPAAGTAQSDAFQSSC